MVRVSPFRGIGLSNSLYICLQQLLVCVSSEVRGWKDYTCLFVFAELRAAALRVRLRFENRDCGSSGLVLFFPAP